MDKPKADKPYDFVRVVEGAIEHTVFTRYSDGSACFITGGYIHGADNGPDAWRSALSQLQAMGFVELREAKTAGLVPEEWQPT